MKKLILVVLDGLNNTAALEKMGFMKHLEELNIAKREIVTASLPTLSRPLYETILTGKEPYEHGILHNDIVRKSKEISIFHKADKAGLTTAAAAYYWISELYMNVPFNPKKDRIQLKKAAPIHYGIYYSEDQYPDSHLFQDAQFLVDEFQPDFLLIHPMNIDYYGHLYGSHSEEYGLSARKADVILSGYSPNWLKEGYDIVVTADHGMNTDKSHGGGLDDERKVPLWYLKSDMKKEFPILPTKQTDVFSLTCKQLGL
ncbi:MAG: alkaline phosphatase family protein [Clostridia bacterium]|nr:alkaline phosphatase family protein [Clostridia bacterium]